jgi:plastocyanin
MFAPMSITVSPGAKISVSNEDSATHTLTAAGKAFDSGDISPGETVTVTAPNKPGWYDYLCDIHQYMTGMIKVG